jgi:hypothetical protein
MPEPAGAPAADGSRRVAYAQLASVENRSAFVEFHNTCKLLMANRLVWLTALGSHFRRVVLRNCLPRAGLTQVTP